MCSALSLSTCSVAVDHFYDESSPQPHEMGLRVSALANEERALGSLSNLPKACARMAGNKQALASLGPCSL